MMRRMNGERFVRRLADALPEAFASVDLVDEYDQAEWTTPEELARTQPHEDAWARTIALADAVQWIEREALAVNRRQCVAAIRPERADELHRFFAYMEQVIAAAADADLGWIMVELFEGIPWSEDVIEVLGPRTRELLRRAQIELEPYNRWIGSWGS
jgi:hypothetical protein